MSGAGMLAGTAGHALAAQVDLPSQPFSVSSTTRGTTLTAPINFATFDNSLGTLTEVDVSVVDVHTGETLGVTPASGAEGGTAAQTDNFMIDSPNQSPIIRAPPVNASVSCVVSSANCPVSSSAFASLLLADFAPNPDDITDPIGMNPFETGSTVSLFAGIDDDPSADSCTTIGAGGSCTFTNDASFSGDLKVTYIYTPNETSVPEPASLALLGIGVLDLGFAQRRQRRAAG